MRIVIHAGRHKTGTTYLQQFLGTNSAQLLRDLGILYPESGRNPYYNYHHDFFENIIKGGDKRASMLDTFNQEISDTKPEIVIFSSEYLSRASIQSEELNCIKECLKGNEIEIILYLRRQDDFLCSRYSEQVKRGLLAYPEKIWKINAELNYLEFLDRYSTVFGHDKIRVRSYDNAMDRGLIDDFASCSNKPELAFLPKPNSTANKRLPWRYLNILWYANSRPMLRTFFASNAVKRAFRLAGDYMPFFFDGKRPITDSEAKHLLQQYAESNDAVSEMYIDGAPLFNIKD